MREKRVLIVDDEKLVCWSLEQMLKDEGYEVRTALDGETARALFRSFNPDMIMQDVRLPDSNGLDMLREYKEVDEDVVVVMITAYADADSAVKALQLGADDYIGKPFDLNKIKHILEQALEKRQLHREVDFFRRELKKKYDYDNLVGNSPGMIDVFKMIKVCAETDAKTVLILGESGTGKELVARAIHYHSARSDMPFVEINCAAIPENLLENELFGHEKGAFTDASRRHRGIFESAEGGTVFLDEIGDMPLPMQAKILKAIETKKYRRLGGLKDMVSDVRIIAATNQNLMNLVEEGRFRGDLYYRLNVMNIPLPPLRERKQDVPALVEYFISRLNEEYGRTVKGVSDRAMEMLTVYSWPGNVRELRNTIERAMMFADDDVLDTDLFRFGAAAGLVKSAHDTPEVTGNQGGGTEAERRWRVKLPPEGVSIEEVERDLIQQALERYAGNQTKAARCLHMTRDTLRYRMKKFGISSRSFTA